MSVCKFARTDNVELARDGEVVLKANFFTNRRGEPITQYYLFSPASGNTWLGTNIKLHLAMARMRAEAAIVRQDERKKQQLPGEASVVAEVKKAVDELANALPPPRSTLAGGAAQLTGLEPRITSLPQGWEAQPLSLLRRPMSRSPLGVADNTPPRSRSQSRND